MPGNLKSRTSQDSFAEALRSEIVAGTENLSTWLHHLQERNGIEALFELECWLKGLRAFFDLRYLPLSESERADLVNRSFVAELRTVRHGIQMCERCLIEVVRLGQPERIEFDSFIEKEIRKEGNLAYHINQVLEQPTPSDSLGRLAESLNDLRVILDAFGNSKARGCQLFLSLGRTFARDLSACRYIDMLLSQRFRRQYDRMENPVLGALVRNVPGEQLRRNVSLAFLYFYRFLKYLKMIDRDLSADQLLKRCLILFALLQEEIGTCVDFLKSRFLRNAEVDRKLRSAVELIVYSLRSETRRIQEKELPYLTRESEAARVYEKIEDSHGLLRNCCQSSVVALAQSLDEKQDLSSLFPSMADKQQRAQRLRHELWELRQYIRNLLEERVALDFDGIVQHLAAFRESTVKDLMFKDWREFEVFSDSLITAGSDLEVRAMLRQFVSYLETLVQDVSNRAVLKGGASAPQPI